MVGLTGGIADALVISAEQAQLAADGEIAAGLRSEVVVAAFECLCIEPDAGEQVEVLIGGNSELNGLQQFRGDIQGRFFSGLKRWNGCATAAGGAVIAGIDEQLQVGHGDQPLELPGVFGGLLWSALRSSVSEACEVRP